MAEQIPMQERIITKAMKDMAFRQQLLSNPKAVLERELGVTLPAGLNIEVHEDTFDTVHLLLPMPRRDLEADLQDLSDEELEAVGGGNTNINPYYDAMGMGRLGE